MAANDDPSAFQRLFADERRLRALLAGSCYFDATFPEWERGRRFIAAAINQSGALLDVGCANGFLLRCLKAWSSHALVPYGIDVVEARVRQARALFPRQANHFTMCDARRFVNRRTDPASDLAAFPDRFDLIYWNV